MSDIQADKVSRGKTASCRQVPFLLQIKFKVLLGTRTRFFSVHSFPVSVLLSFGPLCVDISLNLPSQPESGVATPPKKPWPPSGDRRVSASIPASSQSESPRGSLWVDSELAWLLACMSVIHNRPTVNSRVLVTVLGF